MGAGVQNLVYSNTSKILENITTWSLEWEKAVSSSCELDVAINISTLKQDNKIDAKWPKGKLLLIALVFPKRWFPLYLIQQKFGVRWQLH